MSGFVVLYRSHSSMACTDHKFFEKEEDAIAEAEKQFAKESIRHVSVVPCLWSKSKSSSPKKDVPK